VLLGVETNGWVESQDNVTLTLGSVTGTVTFYPKASSGFFLKGGAGASFISTDEVVASRPCSAWRSVPAGGMVRLPASPAATVTDARISFSVLA
jgi:hypothetical protein